MQEAEQQTIGFALREAVQIDPGLDDDTSLRDFLVRRPIDRMEAMRLNGLCFSRRGKRFRIFGHRWMKWQLLLGLFFQEGRLVLAFERARCLCHGFPENPVLQRGKPVLRNPLLHWSFIRSERGTST